MKTLVLLLILATNHCFAKMEVEPWTPEPVHVIIDGKEYIYYPPIEYNESGEKW